MIQYYYDSNVYVHTPANVATGGVELLHQFVHTLRNNGISAFIVLYGEEPYVIHQEYLKYNVVSALECDIDDNPHNIEVYTEVMSTLIMGNNRKTQKIMWWMSVDNYFLGKFYEISLRDIFKWDKNIAFDFFRYRLKLSVLSLSNKFKNKYSVHSIQKNGCSFAYQCEYIKSFLLKLGIQRPVPLSDYINTDFSILNSAVEKEDIVLYNPSKGLEFTNKLIKLAPDINWVPIKNLKRHELIELISKAKLYIDFGNHPGKDRLPRECALAKCCIITGKQGSAGFERDLPIPASYKFDEKLVVSSEEIVDKIRYVLNHYSICIDDFAQYRHYILLEKQKFENEVMSLFSSH